jgi:hypothetical protein
METQGKIIPNIMQCEYFGAVSFVTTQLDFQLININASEANKAAKRVF